MVLLCNCQTVKTIYKFTQFRQLNIYRQHSRNYNKSDIITAIQKISEQVGIFIKIRFRTFQRRLSTQRWKNPWFFVVQIVLFPFKKTKQIEIKTGIFLTDHTSSKCNLWVHSLSLVYRILPIRFSNHYDDTIVIVQTTGIILIFFPKLCKAKILIFGIFFIFLKKDIIPWKKKS